MTDLGSIYQDNKVTDADGNAVARMAFAAIDEEENAYFGEKSGISTRQLTVDMAREWSQTHSR
jgi:hypothetical protein